MHLNIELCWSNIDNPETILIKELLKLQILRSDQDIFVLEQNVFVFVPYQEAINKCLGQREGFVIEVHKEKTCFAETFTPVNLCTLSTFDFVK